MNVTRESLEKIYSSKTDEELLLINEEPLTETAKEVVQKIKQERNLTEEACIAAKKAAADEKEMSRQNKIKNIKSKIKTYSLNIYIFLILLQIKPAIQHDMLIIPIVMALPLVACLIWDAFKSKKS